MSDEDDAYLRVIETQFLALKGRGYAMSARDVGRVLAWRADGVPLRLVVGKLQESFRARGASKKPVTLAAARRGIDEAMKKRAERQVPVTGVSEPSPSERLQRIAQLEASLTMVGQRVEERLRPALRDAWRRLRELAEQDASPWSIADEVDELIGASLVKFLDDAERAAFEAAIDARLSPHMDAEARAEKRRFGLAKAARERFEVPLLLQVLLDAR